MNAQKTELRLRQDGMAVVAEWTSHLDPDNTKDLRGILRDQLLARGVDLDDEREVARYALEVKGHPGWFEFRGAR